MYKHIPFAILLGTIALFANAVHAGRGGSQPWIDGTRIDVERSVLTIQGRGFGLTTPGVYMGKQLLRVQSASDQEIVAELPRGAGGGSYRLRVVKGRPPHSSSEPFFVAVPTAQN